MRLRTLHPSCLDRPGLLALWPEALLAQAVLPGRTKGYRHHSQLERFRKQAGPPEALAAYLAAVHSEAFHRGDRFDKGKICKQK